MNQKNRPWVITVCAILTLPVLPAIAACWFHPATINWNPEVLNEGEVRIATVAEWGNVLWVDARSQLEYEHGHITGACRLNEDDWDEQLPQLIDRWNPGQKIVVYCAAVSCLASRHVAERLRTEVGLTDVYVLKGGWEAVANSLFPIEKGNNP